MGNGGSWQSTGDLGHFWACHLLLHAWGPSGRACPPCADPKTGLNRVRVDPSVDSAALWLLQSHVPALQAFEIAFHFVELPA